MTSKYAHELCQNFPRIKDVKKATREILEQGGDLAFKEIHDATSLKRLKKEIMKKQNGK